MKQMLKLIGYLLTGALAGVIVIGLIAYFFVHSPTTGDSTDEARNIFDLLVFVYAEIIGAGIGSIIGAVVWFVRRSKTIK